MTIKERLNRFATAKHSSILSASLVLGITFIISALLGFLRTRILYDHFFKLFTSELDAFNAAFRLPDLIFKLLVSGALSASFIPVYASFLHKDKEEADRVASAVINLLFLVFLGASISVFIFARPISHLIAPGFSQYQLAVMVSLTRILLFAQIFFLLSNFLTSILQVNQIFLLPAISPLIYNLAIIVSIYLFSKSFGLYGVAWGTVVGAFLHFVIQLPALKQQGFKYSLILNYRLQGVKEIIRLMIPQSIAIGISEIEITVTLFFTSLLAAGSLSLLNLAFQLMYLPSRIFSTTVGQASLPILAKHVAKGEHDKFRHIVNKTVLQSLFLALPIAIMILILRLDLVRIVFGTKHFPWSATKITASALGFLTPVIVCQAIIQIIIRAFYALHNTKLPLYTALISLIVCTISSVLFINYTSLGIAGLAFSTALGDMVQCISLLVCYVVKVDGKDWQITVMRFFKILLAAIICGIFTWIAMRILDTYVLNTARVLDVILVFGFSALIGLIGYLVACYLLKIKEFNDYIHFISRR